MVRTGRDGGRRAPRLGLRSQAGRGSNARARHSRPDAALRQSGKELVAGDGNERYFPLLFYAPSTSAASVSALKKGETTKKDSTSQLYTLTRQNHGTKWRQRPPFSPPTARRLLPA